MGVEMRSVPKEEARKMQLGKSFKKLNLLQKTILAILFVLLMIFSFPIVLILIAGLLPTITVMYTDKHNYDKQIIVGCFNIAGVFFYLFGVINKFSEKGSFNMADDISMLIVMLGMAPVGMFIYNELPNLYVYFKKANYQKRIEKINKRLNKLAEDWGIDINNISLESKD